MVIRLPSLSEWLSGETPRIIQNRKEGKVFVSDFPNGEGKYISVVFDEGQDPYDVSLQVSKRVELRLTYILHDQTITGVQITKVNGSKIDGKLNFSTMGFSSILALLQIFTELDLKSIANNSLILDASIVGDEDALKKHLKTILADEKGQRILAELADNNTLQEGDIKNLAQKRVALDLFEQLLHNEHVFTQKKAEWGKHKDEDVWQQFFEDNRWIFGYGLEYVFNAPIDENKFQQVLRGSDFNDPGKRPDGILKTLGLINFLNIVEIKTHNTPLLENRMYRGSRVWGPSSDLVGAISQCNQYVRTSVQHFDEVIRIKDKEGNFTGEEVFQFKPKCFLVVGSSEKDFLDPGGKVLNPDKLSCFEHFRGNLTSPEIITFDQLYQRAKNIVELAS